MSRRCPECGGLLGAGDAFCRACGLAVAGTPPPRRAPAPAGPLGDIPPESDGDAFDLSAILEGVDPAVGGIPAEAPRAKGRFVPAFTFPGGEAPPSAAPAAPLESSAPPRPADSAGPTDAPAGDGWRVRNANGTIYDMASVEAVVQWLQNKDSFDGIRISRGGGPLRMVEEHPDLVARLGMRPVGSSFASEEAAPRLDLEVTGRRPPGSRSPAASRTPGRAPSKGVAPAAGAAARPATRTPPPGRTFGMGFTLILVACGLVVTVVSVVALGHVESVGASAEPVSSVDAPAESPPGPGLAAALVAFEAERFTAAEQLLYRAAQTEGNDPRIHRYLALTLYKLGGRDAAARAALAEFRRARLRAGGE